MKKIGVIGRFILSIVVLLVVIILMCAVSGGFRVIINLIDMPSALGLLIALLCGLAATGQWKDFWAVFALDKKPHSLLQLKNTIEAVGTAQRLVVYGGIVEAVVGVVAVLMYLDRIELLGPNLAVTVLSIFYVAVFEFMLLPLKSYAVRMMNKEMDFEEE